MTTKNETNTPITFTDSVFGQYLKKKNIEKDKEIAELEKQFKEQELDVEFGKMLPEVVDKELNNEERLEKQIYALKNEIKELNKSNMFLGKEIQSLKDQLANRDKEWVKKIEKSKIFVAATWDAAFLNKLKTLKEKKAYVVGWNDALTELKKQMGVKE